MYSAKGMLDLVRLNWYNCLRAAISNGTEAEILNQWTFYKWPSSQRGASLLVINSDLSQTSHRNIKGLSVSEVMRTENMITQVKAYWYFSSFSPLLL